MIQSVKGMHDMLPDESNLLRQTEETLIKTLDSFGYREIRLPLLEKTELFTHSLGKVTDIVEKEMYSFEDRGGDCLSLRPEGTASCVRAGLQHGLLRQGCRHRLWYSGEFFRRERPQKGRYRQFRQIGAEAFGFDGPDLDAELLMMTALMWDRLGLGGQLKLKLNTLGNVASRQRYRDDLISYWVKNESQLDDNARQRIHTNPLRVFDSKDARTREVILNAPRLSAYLDNESARHFKLLKEILGLAGIDYEEDEYLVRGLDYYTHAVFEWVIINGGAQATVCAGGRYDNLVESLGGSTVAAVGFAVGVERLADLIEPDIAQSIHVYIVAVGEQAILKSHQLAADLHQSLPHRRIVVNCGGGSFKVQMKRADKLGAKVALLIGEDEIKKGTVTIKLLRRDQAQMQMSVEQVCDQLEQYLL